MHALEWIEKHGRYLRRISAGKLRKELNRPKKHCTWCGKKIIGKRYRWCSNECVEEFRVRCDPGWAAYRVWERDGNICAMCGEKKYCEVDHIVPVSKGGGLCPLDNLRMLCQKCHRKETNKLRGKKN